MEKYIKMLKDSGADEVRVIDPATVKTAAWVQNRCKFQCKWYAKSCSCPPYAPSYKETREILDDFSKAILFNCHVDGLPTKIALPVARELFIDGYYKTFTFGAGACHQCGDNCNPKKCNRPGTMAPTMEGSGIDVFATARANDMPIKALRSKDETPNFYGLILVE